MSDFSQLHWSDPFVLRPPLFVEFATGGNYTRAVARQIPELDPHRLAEERSLAYHRVIGERLLSDPALIERARARVRCWMEVEDPPPYARAWNEILSQGPAAISAFLVDPSERARELRQSSPFAGALTARERWALWRQLTPQASPADDA